ncbi:S-adenosyl-L-methionine-dependent methyltransferase [Stipitochalara longipes BDJ]|nr:S-adenosyl-L-methionine-dependent methyltransferase [Stipitochalara longipes BDJ]
MTALRFKPSAFTPPQANIVQPPWMKATQGTIPCQIAQSCILALPPITTDSVVHDNGCGDGNVTRSILSQRTAATYPSVIYATDIASELLSKLQEEVAHNTWPVVTTLASAQDLPFQDNVFTHSITNCVILRLDDEEAVQACKEAYRTLKKGGAAAVSAWAEVPHRKALAAAHAATRPKGAGDLVGGAVRWIDGRLLRRCMEKGGFECVRMLKAKSVWEVEDLDVWVRVMWSMLGRMESGWIESDHMRWNEAVKVFGKVIRNQEGVELLGNGRARMTGWCWIALAQK